VSRPDTRLWDWDYDGQGGDMMGFPAQKVNKIRKRHVKFSIKNVSTCTNTNKGRGNTVCSK